MACTPCPEGGGQAGGQQPQLELELADLPDACLAQIFGHLEVRER